MTGNHFSLILLSTNKCNAACDYCFEDKTNHRFSLERLRVMFDKVLDHMEVSGIGSLTVHWQGGEAMLLPPSWYEQAHAMIQAAAAARGKQVGHGLQTNMLIYSANPLKDIMVVTKPEKNLKLIMKGGKVYKNELGK